ncbi:MAG: DCC1-like thiol-disulfide oxidoreductase family protein [Chloroflexota bacterium]
MAEWLRRLDRRRTLYLVPFQWTWVLDGVGLTVKDCEEALWAVTLSTSKETTAKYRGAEAVSFVLDEILPVGRTFSTIYKLPFMKPIEDTVYQWVADNRKLFPSVTPAMKQEPPWDPDNY